MGYSIVKESEHEFIVVCEEQAVLKCASRRTAAKAIADAQGLTHAPLPQNKPGPRARKQATEISTNSETKRR
jgi:hypothetical protein